MLFSLSTLKFQVKFNFISTQFFAVFSLQMVQLSQYTNKLVHDNLIILNRKNLTLSVRPGAFDLIFYFLFLIKDGERCSALKAHFSKFRHRWWPTGDVRDLKVRRPWANMLITSAFGFIYSEPLRCFQLMRDQSNPQPQEEFISTV